MGGCCGKAKWKREEVPDHKFDFIDVRDYYSNTFFMRLKYLWLYIMVGKSIAVYIADVYTAVTLLALNHFNGNVYSRVADHIPFDYCKWIFSGCIIFSFLLLAYEAHKSRSVVRSRDISYAYTNVMANNYYSLRSYDHFCFFNQINNSKKKKDEFAFFIFFTFKGWKRLLVADGPRQVINALTLFWIASASHWSANLSDYYEGNYFTAIMLLTMMFTVVIFAGSALMLALASAMYIPLICYIQGNLKDYCCHKIDKRISELVQKKKKQRLGKYAAIARAEAAGDFSHLMNKQGIIVGQKMVQPTLPQLDVDLYNDDKQFKGQALNRTGSMSSSTVNGMQGGDKGFYGVKEGDDYASTAQLVMNQGYAGSAYGHAPPGMNGSMSSHTLNNFSAPGTSSNSPDAYPVRFRGMAAQQDGYGGGAEGASNILAQMGPIGTSPGLFAQRQVGMGYDAGVKSYGQQNGAMGGEAYEMEAAEQYAYASNGDHDLTRHGNGLTYNNHMSQTDISAYAPYEYDSPRQGDLGQYRTGDNPGYLAAGQDGNGRVQSFAFGDVYDAYLQEPAQYDERGGGAMSGRHTPVQDGYGDDQDARYQQYDQPSLRGGHAHSTRDSSYNPQQAYTNQGPYAHGYANGYGGQYAGDRGDHFDAR
jgi:hypothetical protein